MFEGVGLEPFPHDTIKMLHFGGRKGSSGSLLTTAII